MYAVIEACGKQYKVTKGDVVFFEKLEAEEGKKVTFDKVVLLSDEGKIEVGAPYVKGIKVEGKVVSHGKHKKIVVFKMKAKKNERTKQGHRQPYTKVEITSIKTAAKKAEAKVLKLRFGLEDGKARTLEEVGREFDVTRERIRQIEAKALRKLRHPSRSKKLRDYMN